MISEQTDTQIIACFRVTSSLTLHYLYFKFLNDLITKDYKPVLHIYNVIISKTISFNMRNESQTPTNDYEYLVNKKFESFVT